MVRHIVCTDRKPHHDSHYLSQQSNRSFIPIKNRSIQHHLIGKTYQYLIIDLLYRYFLFRIRILKGEQRAKLYSGISGAGNILIFFDLVLLLFLFFVLVVLEFFSLGSGVLDGDFQS